MTPVVRSFTMTQHIIDGWAELSGDFNPLHVDPEYASGTQFGTTIAHGHIALALMEGLMLDIAGEGWLSGGRLENARFRAPVRPGLTFELVAKPTDAQVWSLEVREPASGKVCVTASAAYSDAAGEDL